MCLSSSPAAARRGAQEPRVDLVEADVASTDGPDAAALIASMGMKLLPWESHVLDAWCSRDALDRPACVSCGLSVPRQNGKNAILEALELYGLVVCGWHVLHTAHRVKTAKKSFQRLVRYFTDKRHPEVLSLVENIRYTNGEESVYLKNGAAVEFSARSRASSRGFDDIQLVIFDEAQDLTDDQLNAIMYTLAASSTGDRMMVYTGTSPDPSSPGTVFRRVRRQALDRPAPRSCWHEWGVEELPAAGSAFEDVLDAVYATNPSMGEFLDPEFTRTEFDNSSLDGFARERLGWWSPDAQGADHVISAEDWDACATADPPEDGVMCAAAKFSPDGSRVSLAVCLNPKEGTPYVEVVANKSTNSGTRWLADWLVARRDKVASVAIDGRRGESVVQALRDGGFPSRFVRVPSSSDVAKANALLVDRVQAREVRHYGQPDLDSAACGCVRRQIGADGFGFADTETADSTLIEACALALREALTTKRRPGRKAVVL